MNISLKQKIVALIIALGVILIAIFQIGFGGKVTPVNDAKEQTQTPDPSSKFQSVSPSNLEGAVISPTQVIEVTFGLPLENQGEVKWQIEPKADLKVELSDDKKTAKFIPQKPYELGQSYNLSIKPDTKFDGKKTLEMDLHWAFRTITYNGV